MLALSPRTLCHLRIISVLVLSAATLASCSSWWGDDHGFDESHARDVVKLTQAAYCTDQLVGWNCTACGSFPGMANVSILQGKSRNVRGFVGVDLGARRVENDVAVGDEGAALPLTTAVLDGSSRTRGLGVPARGAATDAAATATKTVMSPLGFRDVHRTPDRPRVVVTFSGTDPKSIKNWIDDLEAKPIAHVYAEGGCQECTVHRGFLAAYEVVQEQIRAAVTSHLHYNPSAEVLITGHSLGGALATLCFLDLKATLGAKASFSPLYIFGAPRVGNAAFAAYTSSLGLPIFRVVHYRDPVPHLPFEAWGYNHPGREVFFDATQTSHVVCDESGEDPTCSNQFWFLPDMFYVRDHLAYLEVDYTKAYVQCLLGREEGAEAVVAVER